MQFAEFYITDGQTSIDLLAGNKGRDGIHIVRYTPGRPQPKAGGVWRDSPLAPGRRRVQSVLGNVSDAVEIRIAHCSHEQLADAQEALDLMLEKAEAYWESDWTDEPVYVRARYAGDSSPKYAILYGAQFSEYPDPYAQPYLGVSVRYVMDSIILGLERSPWMENPPGEQTAVATSSPSVSATTQPVWVANARMPGLNAIYQEDSGGFSSNLVNQATPFTLFSDDAVDSAIYFGSEQPFSTLIFNLTTAFAATGWVIEWEYSNDDTVTSSGAVWGSLADYIADYTDGFAVAGQNAVQFKRASILSDWEPYELVAGAEYYWVRARIDSVSGSVTLPVQGAFQVYSPYRAYVDIAAAQVGGDLPALGRVRRTSNLYDDQITSFLSFGQGDRSQIMAVRSLDRGANFSAFVNLQDGYNPTGVTVELEADVSTLEPALNSPTGEKITWTPFLVADTTQAICRIRLEQPIIEEYYGRYRMFVRGRFGSDIAWLRHRTKYEFAQNEWVGERRPHPALPANSYGAIDLGYITIPPTNQVRSIDLSEPVIISIEGYLSGDGQVTGEVIDFVFMPADEWTCQTVGYVGVNGEIVTEETIIFDTDSLGQPKENIRSLLRDGATDNVADTLQTIGSQPVQFSAAINQRLWLLQIDQETEVGSAFSSMAIEVARSERYHHLRAAR